MRTLVVSLILLCSCNEQLPHATEVDLNWASSAKNRTEPLVFHPLDTTFIRTTGGDSIAVEFLRRDSSYYLVLGNDTTTDPLWDSGSRVDVPWYDSAIVLFTPVKLYDDQHLVDAIRESARYDSAVYFLINETDGEYEHRIGLGIVHTANTDEDVYEERIVEVVLAVGCRTCYYFFDDSTTGWKSHGKVERWSRWPFWEVDAHLSGYVGFIWEMWGCGFGATCYDYYRLTEDSVQLCFTINTKYGLWIYPTIGYSQYLMSSAESQRVGDRIKVVHRSQYDLRDTSSAENVLFKCTDQSQYEFVPASEGRYTPVPRSPAFNTSDSTMFVVEYAMMKKVYQRKRNGSAYEKFLLRNIEEDSIPLYR